MNNVVSNIDIDIDDLLTNTLTVIFGTIDPGVIIYDCCHYLKTLSTILDTNRGLLLRYRYNMRSTMYDV